MGRVIIGFSKPRRWALHAWLIEKVDAAPFDHAYIRLNLFEQDLIYQAVKNGVQFINRELWLKTDVPVYEYMLEVASGDYEKLVQFCFQNCGVPYRLLSTIGEGLVKLHLVRKNPFNVGLSGEFCSEIVARALNKLPQFNIDAANTSPHDLQKIVTSL